MDTVSYYCGKVRNYLFSPPAQTIKNLMNAIREGDTEKVQMFIDSGVNVNELEPGVGMKPIITASWNGKKEIVNLLIKAGAEINATDLYFAQTALMGAANHGHTEIVDILLKAKANVFLVDNDKRNALMMAIDTAKGIPSAFLILGSMTFEQVMDIQNNHQINFPLSRFSYPAQTIVVSKYFNFKRSKAQYGLVSCFKEAEFLRMKTEIFRLYWRSANQPDYANSHLNTQNTPAEILAYLFSQRYFVLSREVIAESIEITTNKINKMLEIKKIKCDLNVSLVNNNSITNISTAVIFSKNKRNRETAELDNIEEVEKQNKKTNKVI